MDMLEKGRKDMRHLFPFPRGPDGQRDLSKTGHGWGDAEDYEKTDHAFGGGKTAEPAIPQREIEMCGEGVTR